MHRSRQEKLVKWQPRALRPVQVLTHRTSWQTRQTNQFGSVGKSRRYLAEPVLASVQLPLVSTTTYHIGISKTERLLSDPVLASARLAATRANVDLVLRPHAAKLEDQASQCFFDGGKKS
jgi:hypothetical protein